MGGVDGHARQLQAQAALNWKGEVSQFSAGSSGANQMPIVLPLQLTPPAAVDKNDRTLCHGPLSAVRAGRAAQHHKLWPRKEPIERV